MTVLEQAQAAFPGLTWEDDDDPEHFASADLYDGCSMQLEYFAGYVTGPEVQAVVVCGDYGDMQEFATVPEALDYLRTELTKMRDRLNVALGDDEVLRLRERVAVLERRSAATPRDVKNADEIDETIQLFEEVAILDPVAACGRMIELYRGLLEDSRTNFNACARLEARLRDIAAAVEALPEYDHHEYCNLGDACDCCANKYNTRLTAAKEICREPT